MPSIQHEPWCTDHVPREEAGTEICVSQFFDIGGPDVDRETDYKGYTYVRRDLDDTKTTVEFFYGTSRAQDHPLTAVLVDMLVAAIESDPADLLTALKAAQSRIASEQVPA